MSNYLINLRVRERFWKSVLYKIRSIVIKPLHKEHENDGSNFRLVCERISVLGGNPWHHIQGDQCLGVCDHLADIDGYSIWHYRSTAEKNPSIIAEQ